MGGNVNIFDEGEKGFELHLHLNTQVVGVTFQILANIFLNSTNFAEKKTSYKFTFRYTERKILTALY